MKIRRCLKCMALLNEDQQTCPGCGRVYGRWQAEPFALRPGTILDGKYLIGEMLGQGGFGITYLGFDLLLEQKVAIKEYFPMSTGMVSRDGQSTVVWSTAMMGKSGKERGFDSFLKEARKMAKLGGIPGVVGVKSVFIENETAYIVMDYIEGETLQKKLEREGPMDFDTCTRLLMPIMHSLAQVHSHGIIHRDISPDNIMVQPNGELILLDLGAAKELDYQKPDGTIQSSQLVAKHGFSPFEQYAKTGKLGPWTDVYAMAATIYYCCTGKLLPAAVERTMGEPLTCRPLLTEAQFRLLEPALALKPEKRTQNMTALARSLSQSPEPPPPPPPRKFLKWAIAAIAGLAALSVLLLLPKGNTEQKDPTTVQVQTTVAATPPTEATRKTYTMAKMESANGDDDEQKAASPFWGQSIYARSEVKRVVFQSTLKEVGADAWDVSADGDKSILAWMDNGTLHVAADGNISPNSDASFLFHHFRNLTEIGFEDCFNTSQVTDMGFMFSGCSGLTSLDVSEFDTTQVTDMGWMFEGCSDLTSLDISGFNTSQVTYMGGMFSDCSNLTNLDVSGFDTSRLTDMGFMFFYCSSLTELDLSRFDTSQVTDMGYMFSYCSGLTSLDVSGFDTSQVTDMGYMFSGCSSITSFQCVDERILEEYRKVTGKSKQTVKENSVPAETTIVTQSTTPNGYYSSVAGSWGDKAKIGNANVGLYVLNDPLVNCKKMTVNVRITMNAGTHCENWILWGRENGQMKQLGEINLDNGEGFASKSFSFTPSISIDAITVTPTIPGGYSWSTGMSVTDVWLEE